MINERKYTLLLMAGQDRQEGETITQAYNRLYGLVSSNDDARADAVIDALKLKATRTRRKKRKYKARKGVSEGFANAMSAIIALDRSGKEWSLTDFRRQAKISAGMASYWSARLQQDGYLKRRKVRGQNKQKWTVLKNADGSAYVRKNVTQLRKAA